jgi:hypothetical protein
VVVTGSLRRALFLGPAIIDLMAIGMFVQMHFASDQSRTVLMAMGILSIIPGSIGLCIGKNPLPYNAIALDLMLLIRHWYIYSNTSVYLCEDAIG